MAEPLTTTVATLTDYVQEIDRLLEEAKARNGGVSVFQNWYRGVRSNVQHKLQPSLFRISRPNELAYLNLEAQMMLDFERHAILRSGTPVDDEDKRSRILKLFHMQHYGVPTRLLDWTTNPFVSLYFALASGLSDDTDQSPAIWVLDPWGWNRKIMQTKGWEDLGPAHVTHSAVNGWHPRESYDQRDLLQMEAHPVVVVGVYNTERMRAQRGVFTLFGKRSSPMEDVYHAEDLPEGCLHRIDIDRDNAEMMFSKLIQLGYTDSVAYPDFHGVSLEIRRTHGYPL